MAVYYKFKSAKDYDSMPTDGHFISVLSLKEKIYEKKRLGGTDFDLIITNAQTNEEYIDEAMLIPKNTSVLIRRVPGRPRMPIVTQSVIQQDDKPDNAQPTVGSGSSVMKYPEDSEWDEFGNDLYAIPETLPVQINNPVQNAPPPSKDDEDTKFRALIDTPALDWQRGYGRGRRIMMGGRGFGRGGFEKKTPPPGYVCHRCNQPGHFIQHCPTNDIPEFNVKRVKPPTGIPKSMLMAAPEGLYALPSGAVAVLKPNEAAFEKEIEGLPSKRPVSDLPPELHCPLCKEVMKDAVLTSKCCFTSFCDKCIRDHIISKAMCVCGANNILADDLIPNKTVRDTINRTMERNNSIEIGGSTFQVQETGSKMEHLRIQQKVPTPAHLAASRENQASPPQNEESSKVKDAAGQGNVLLAPQNSMEQGTEKIPDVSGASRDPMAVKEHASQGGGPLADGQVQPKPASGDAGKKKKKKKTRVASNEMQWNDPQDFAMQNYMMPMGPSAYNPYWNGMQPGMEGFLPPFGGPMPPFMSYGPGPFDAPLGSVPQDPFGVPNMMMMPPPFPPQRDLAEINMGMGMNVGPPIMSREEFEARKADLRRKREIEKEGERDLLGVREVSREMSSGGDISSRRPKSKPFPPPSNEDQTNQHHSSDRPSPLPEHLARKAYLPRPSSKHKTLDYDQHRDHRYHIDTYHRRDHYHHRSDTLAKSSIPEAPPPAKSAASVAAPEEKAAKKRTNSSSEVEPPASSGASYGHKNRHHDDHKAVAVNYESSEDEDRHFKRRPARYEASPAPVEDRKDRRHSKGMKEKERERKHRRVEK